MSHGRSVRSRVGRLESARARGAGVCPVCRGEGYPGLYVRAGDEAEPARVGTTGCSGCGRARMAALVVLPGESAEGWAGAGGGR